MSPTRATEKPDSPCARRTDMEHHCLVLPEHMNPHGDLFGGYLLKWLDEFSYITANIDHPGCKFVTVSLDEVSFNHRIESGEILRFDVRQTRLGNTSVEYGVEVFGERGPAASKGILFETRITFVNVDDDGGKRRIPRP